MSRPESSMSQSPHPPADLSPQQSRDSRSADDAPHSAGNAPLRDRTKVDRSQEIEALDRALSANDIDRAHEHLRILLVKEPGDPDLLLVAAQVSALRRPPIAAKRFVGASHAAWGCPRNVEGRSLSAVIAIGTAAAQMGGDALGLDLLLRLSRYCRNNQPLIGMLIARALLDVDLANVSDATGLLVEALVERSPSEDVAVHVMQAALRFDCVETGLDLLRNAGVPGTYALKAAILAGAKTRKRLGRAAYFHPDPVPEHAKQFYVVAPAKSASVFVAHTLADLFGLPILNLSFAKLTSDDLDLDTFLAHLPRNAVLHQHAPATALVRSAFSEFDIRPLVPVRNVFDTLVSLRDWRAAMNYSVDRRFVSLDEADQFHVLMAEDFPKLLHFFTTWYRAIKSGHVNGFMVDSRTLVERPAPVLQKYLTSLHDVHMDLHRIEAAIEAVGRSPRKVNFNPKRGTRLAFGAGYQILPKEIIASARAAFRGYPDVDFSILDPQHPDREGSEGSAV